MDMTKQWEPPGQVTHLEGQGPDLVVHDLGEAKSQHQQHQELAVHGAQGDPQVRAEHEGEVIIIVVSLSDLKTHKGSLFSQSDPLKGLQTSSQPLLLPARLALPLFDWRCDPAAEAAAPAAPW